MRQGERDEGGWRASGEGVHVVNAGPRGCRPPPPSGDGKAPEGNSNLGNRQGMLGCRAPHCTPRAPPSVSVTPAAPQHVSAPTTPALPDSTAAGCGPGVGHCEHGSREATPPTRGHAHRTALGHAHLADIIRVQSERPKRDRCIPATSAWRKAMLAVPCPCAAGSHVTPWARTVCLPLPAERINACCKRRSLRKEASAKEPCLQQIH